MRNTAQQLLNDMCFTMCRICRWFPQFMFTLLTHVRPIKVGILKHFLRVADHGLPIVLIKKELKNMNPRVRFTP